MEKSAGNTCFKMKHQTDICKYEEVNFKSDKGANIISPQELGNDIQASGRGLRLLTAKVKLHGNLHFMK